MASGAEERRNSLFANLPLDLPLDRAVPTDDGFAPTLPSSSPKRHIAVGNARLRRSMERDVSVTRPIAYNRLPKLTNADREARRVA